VDERLDAGRILVAPATYFNSVSPLMHSCTPETCALDNLVIRLFAFDLIPLSLLQGKIFIFDECRKHTSFLAVSDLG